MKRAVRLSITLLLLASLFIIGSVSVHAADASVSYSPEKALKYADDHYLDKTSYDKKDQDCVKFVRKCVEAGGVPVEKDRSYGYSPQQYIDYIVKNGWADLKKMKLTVHSWSVSKGYKRYYINPVDNAGNISPGDIIVYKCTKKKCKKTYYHVELVNDITGEEVTCYGHNPSKGPNSVSSSGSSNDEVITFPHSSCIKKNDEYTEIYVLHFREHQGLFCKHSSVGSYTTTKKATFTTAGEKTAVCSTCGADVNKTIPAVTKVSASDVTYTGKNKTPSVSVKNSKSKSLSKVTATSSNGYMLQSASDAISVGTYSVDVILTGPDYEGTKTVKFKVNPKGTSISKVAGSKKAFTVKWKKQSSKMKTARVAGYQVRYSKSSKMSSAKTVTVKKYSSTSKKISKLSAKKYYYVQVRTYMTVDDVKYYSSWSAKKKVKTK